MDKYLFSVPKNKAFPPEKIKIQKETAKTYVLDDICDKIIRKSKMENRFTRFFLKEEDAVNFFNQK